MSSCAQWARFGWASLSAAAVLLVGGCGPSGPEIVPAAGQVLIDGQPLATGIQGFIRVVPTDGRAATGSIDPQTGKFKLTTAALDDGCITGTHKVLIVMQQMVGQESVSLVPEKYTDLEQTDLTVTVDGPTDALVVELTGPLKPARPDAMPVSDDPNKL